MNLRRRLERLEESARRRRVNTARPADGAEPKHVPSLSGFLGFTEDMLNQNDVRPDERDAKRAAAVDFYWREIAELETRDLEGETSS